MNDQSSAAVFARAERFAEKWVVACAIEILEWHNTGLLRNARLRELADILESIYKNDGLAVAEKIATRHALKIVAQGGKS